MKGVRTWKYPKTFTRTFYPHWQREEPELRALAQTLAAEKFGALFNPQRGVVECPPHYGYLQPALAAIPPASRSRPKLIFFCKKIPTTGAGMSWFACTEDFQRRAPIVDYEALAPLIERIADGEQNLLFTAPALAFETTGGSHSGGKLIPYTARGLDDFRRALTGWLADTIAGHRLAAGRPRSRRRRRGAVPLSPLPGDAGNPMPLAAGAGGVAEGQRQFAPHLQRR